MGGIHSWLKHVDTQFSGASLKVDENPANVLTAMLHIFQGKDVKKQIRVYHLCLL